MNYINKIVVIQCYFFIVTAAAQVTIDAIKIVDCSVGKSIDITLSNKLTEDITVQQQNGTDTYEHTTIFIAHAHIKALNVIPRFLANIYNKECILEVHEIKLPLPGVVIKLVYDKNNYKIDIIPSSLLDKSTVLRVVVINSKLIDELLKKTNNILYYAFNQDYYYNDKILLYNNTIMRDSFVSLLVT